MNRPIVILIFSFSFLFISQAHAAVSPVAISIVPPVEFPADDFTITGLRASLIYGQHQDIYGVDLGLIGNVTTQTFAGIALSGVFNWTEGETTAIGAQIAGIVNYNKSKTNVYGVQGALGLNYNLGESSVTGLQLALVNMSEHTSIYGFQVGAYNKAQRVYGFQIGIVNVCENLHGLQIGLLNFHTQGIFAVSPILNFGF